MLPHLRKADQHEGIGAGRHQARVGPVRERVLGGLAGSLRGQEPGQSLPAYLPSVQQGPAMRTSMRSAGCMMSQTRRPGGSTGMRCGLLCCTQGRSPLGWQRVQCTAAGGSRVGGTPG